jgi:hypothetical protein
MALTLDEIKSLIAAFGIDIPGTVLEQRAKAEEFEARREELAAKGAGKPDDWRLKNDFADTLKRAVESAGQQQFGPAFELLDEADQLLQQADAPPPPPPPPPPQADAQAATPVAPPSVEGDPSSQPEGTEADPKAAVDGEAFRKQWIEAKAAWQLASETVDAQMTKLAAKLRASKDKELVLIANYGLNAMTGNWKVRLLVAIREVDAASDEDLTQTAAEAQTVIDAFKVHLGKDKRVAFCDQNCEQGFGVKLTIRRELERGLNRLEEAIQSLPQAQPAMKEG